MTPASIKRTQSKEQKPISRIADLSDIEIIVAMHQFMRAHGIQDGERVKIANLSPSIGTLLSAIEHRLTVRACAQRFERSRRQWRKSLYGWAKHAPVDPGAIALFDRTTKRLGHFANGFQRFRLYGTLYVYEERGIRYVPSSRNDWRRWSGAQSRFQKLAQGMEDSQCS